MKTLRLTILLDEGVSKSELANTFGDFEAIALSNRYLQFNFKNITIMNLVQMRHIINLIATFEQSNPLKFKMLHLYDDLSKQHSPTYITCLRSCWSMISMYTNKDLKTGDSIEKIIT